MTFDLSALIREVHDTTDLTDYRQVAKEIRSRIPDDELEEVVLVALTEVVRVHFTKYHSSHGRDLRPAPGNERVGKPVGGSTKVAAAREWWQRQINQRYATADGQKLLRDFTPEDCEFQAELLRKQAAASLEKADEWDNLLGLIKLNKVAKVGDLA